MAAPIPCPGGKKAQSLVDEYLKCVDEGIYEKVSANEEEARRQWTASQEKRRKLFEAIPTEDLVNVARDGARHAAWQKSNIEHERAQLRQIIQDMQSGEESLEKVRRAKEHLSERLAELDLSSLPSFASLTASI